MRSRVNTRVARISLASLLLLPLAACGGGGGAQPAKTATDGSALGSQKCVTEGDEHRLFVVDWDATDLAGFEARAGRDVVLVKYQGCKVMVLNGCSDDGIAGRYGTYSKPIATSGTIESLAVKSDEELYAKLPLGAATFGAEVSRGRALDLTYFVSGTVNATRDGVYRDDLRSNPRCADATHFVAGYALGAFSLASVDKSQVGAGASVAGVGTGAKSSSEAQALKRGGDIATCTSMDPHACRVPIRITLRPISNGARPAVESLPPGTPASTAPADQAMAMMDAVKLRFSAEQKLQAGDAEGCLRDLDRAGATSRDTIDPQTNMVRAKCEMRAGRCDEGKKHYKEAKAAWSRQMDKQGGNTGTTDASLAAEADQMATQYCASAANGGVSAGQSLLTALQGVQRAAAAKDGAACVKEGKALAAAISANASDPMAKAAAGALRTAAICAGEAGKCADAKPLWAAFSKGFFGPSADAKSIDAGFRENVKPCAK